MEIEFLNYFKKVEVAQFSGFEDFSDKFNFFYTMGIYMLCTFIVAFNHYLEKGGIACYIPVEPNGKGFKEYLESYCWVHGTIPLKPTDRMPHDQEEWDVQDKNNKINYYQWVPFLLGMQCVMFYLPRVIWQMICNSETGADLENIVVSTRNAQTETEDRDKVLNGIVEDLVDMLYQHRFVRRGKRATFLRKVYNRCSFCVISKRLGNWIFVLYFITKSLYLANAVGQLYMMQAFLGFNGTLVTFGVELTDHMVSGKDWQVTNIFPRVTFCNAAGIRQVGATNNYMAQCALPINMLNEKIYICLWFWTLAAAMLTIISVPLWLVRVGRLANRVKFIKEYLRINAEYSSSQDEELITNFINKFLRHDGIFILRILAGNCGDLVTSKIIFKLWHIYKSDRFSKLDLTNNPRISYASRDGRNSVLRKAEPYELVEKEDFV